MFSKALFKQSCKANGTMWGIITFAVCFMLACVMLISGNGNIGEVKNSIQDTIITKEIDSQLEKRAISYYTNAEDGLEKFDSFFAENATDAVSYLTWVSAMPKQSDFDDLNVYFAATEKWTAAKPELNTDVGKAYAESVDLWLAQMPKAEEFENMNEYLAKVGEWQDNSPATTEKAVAAAYSGACDELQLYVNEKIKADGGDIDSAAAKEALGSVMYTLNPNGTFDDFFVEHGEDVPKNYDFETLLNCIGNGNVAEYIASKERSDYRSERAQKVAAIFLAGNMTNQETIGLLIEELSSYGVTEEKYDSFGYGYDSVKHMAKNAVITYCGRLEYELDEIQRLYEDGKFANQDEYARSVTEKKLELADDISASFLSTLPSAVSEALEEIGKADLYTLIVGSIFYKLAGLLLPIIYMIMASNNLISGQVDSGSMAYVLSTSTKRSTVVFTQAVFLLGSLFAMFALTTATGCVCLTFVEEDVALTYKNLILLNLGAFLVLFALSGLCFFTSCAFDRSKRSMAVGGGLSIFALVAAMLGLFGSPVIPSVVRLDSLNNFNYATIISLFDVISIIDGTDAFILKFAILAAAGITGYILGSVLFTKKDLPL